MTTTIVIHLKRSLLSQHSSSRRNTSYEGKGLAPKREKKSLGKNTFLTQTPTRIFVMYLEGTKLITNNFSFKKHDI
jgi:hypothetical protein